MRFIEIDEKFCHIKDISSFQILKEQEIILYFRFKKESPFSYKYVKYCEMSPSVKKFYEEIINNTSEENSTIEKLEAKYNELEAKYEELLNAIKYLPVVSGEYIKVQDNYESNVSVAENADGTVEEPIEPILIKIDLLK